MKKPEIAGLRQPRAGTHVAALRSMRWLLLLMALGLVATAEGCGSGSFAPADGSKTCEQLGSDYQAAVYAASECRPGAANQCQVAVPVFLCAGCNVYVNDGAQAIAVEKQFFDQGCDKKDATRCSVETCLQAGPFTCVAADGGSLGGLCSISATATGD